MRAGTIRSILIASTNENIELIKKKTEKKREKRKERKREKKQINYSLSVDFFDENRNRIIKKFLRKIEKINM